MELTGNKTSGKKLTHMVKIKFFRALLFLCLLLSVKNVLAGSGAKSAHICEEEITIEKQQTNTDKSIQGDPKYSVTPFDDVNFCVAAYPTVDYFPLSNFSINEDDKAGFKKSQANKTIILTLPAGWEFNPASAHTVTYIPGRDITELDNINVGLTTISIEVTTNDNDYIDVITYSDFEVRPTASGSGDLRRIEGAGGTFLIENSTDNPDNNESLGHLSSSLEMNITSSAVAQNVTDNIHANCSNSEILEISLTVTGDCPTSVTQFVLSTDGDAGYTENPATNLSNAKIYYAGQTQSFSTMTEFGTFDGPNGAFTINGSQTLSSAGTHYFYLSYFIDAGANVGDKVDAQLTSFTFDGDVIVTSTTPNPLGTRTIDDICFQPDMPNPPSNLTSVLAGSYVIPMDLDHQALDGTPFNLKAYGLVHELLMNDMPIKWVIRSGKGKDEIDFSANVERVYPSAVAATDEDFRASAFIIDPAYIDEPANRFVKSATQIINEFGNNIAVYKLTSDELVDVRYELYQRPKLAVFDNGGNQAVFVAILNAAAITNFVEIDAGIFPGLDECYTFCSEPHWAADMFDDALITQKVWDFVMTGGNFLGQCRGMQAYEQNEMFHATNNISVVNATITNSYHNNDMAFMQFEGNMKSNQSGSERNWTLADGSDWRSGVYYGVTDLEDPDTMVASGGHLINPDAVGGNVFYIGGHNYISDDDLELMNGLRLYLNATLIPSGKPTDFALDQGDDRTICEGENSTLGGLPTGPPGATYMWWPEESLDNPTAANPVATPDETTTYYVVSEKGGCSVGPREVVVTVQPGSDVITPPNDVICASQETYDVGGSVTFASGQLWTTSGSGFFDDENSLFTTYNLDPADGPSVTLTLSAIGSCNDAESSFILTILPEQTPTVIPDFWMRPNCMDSLIGIDYTETGLTWAAVPANPAYDAYLSCTSGCDTTIINSPADPPAFIDYQVSGKPELGCPDEFFNNIIRVNFADELLARIAPDEPAICHPLVGVVLTAETVLGSEGNPPYTYLWSTGSTGASIIAGGEGWYWVDISDNTQCLPVRANVYVTDFDAEITVDADITIEDLHTITVCESNPEVELHGAFEVCGGAMWTGGDGEYAPDEFDMNATYYPSAEEKDAGGVTLTLVAIETMGCAGASDDFVIVIAPNPVANAGLDKDICAGGTTVIGNSPVATGGTTPYDFKWTNVDLDDFTLANPTSSASGITNYTVTVTDANSCTDVSSMTVNVNPLPVATATSISPYCTGDVLTLTGGSDLLTSYNWSGPNGYTNITQSPEVSDSATTLMDGIYNLTVIDGKECTNTASVDVTVFNIPTADAGDNDTICFGQTATIGGSPTASGGAGGYTFNWDNPLTLSDNEIANPISSTAASLTYYVTVTDLNTCTHMDSTKVVVNPIPTAEAGDPKTICSDQTVTIGGTPTASGGTGDYTYNWNNALTINDNEIANPISDANIFTTYTVTVTDEKGCTNTDFMTVTVNVAPTADAGNDKGICNETSVIIGGTPTAGAGTGVYSYFWTNTELDDNTDPNPLSSASSTIKYFITVTDANTCTAVDSMTVTVYDLPTSKPGSDKAICNGKTVVIGDIPAAIGGLGPYTFNWTNTDLDDNTDPNPISSATLTTVYTLTVTDAHLCTDVGTMTVNVNDNPITNPGTDTTICEGKSVTLGGSPTATGGVSPYIFNWTNTDLDDNTDPNPVSSPASPIEYFVTVTDANLCTSVDSISISINDNPIANAGGDTTICAGKTVTIGNLPVATGGASPYTFEWTDTDLDDNTAENPVSSAVETTFYTVTVTDDNSCTNTAIMTVSVNEIPIAEAGIPKTICSGKSVTIGGTPTAILGTSPYSFEWTNSEMADNLISNPVSSATSNTTYSVTVTDVNGCTNTDNVIVTVNASPTAQAGMDKNVCRGLTVGIGGSPTATGGTTPYTYLWNNGIRLNDITSQNPISSAVINTKYKVTVTDASFCTSVDSMNVVVLDIPTADAGNDKTICNGSSTQIGSSPTATGGLAPYSFIWNNPLALSNNTISNPVSSAIVNTTYIVTVTDFNTCTHTDTVDVIVYSTPVVHAGNDTSICDGKTILLNGSFGGGASTVTWTSPTSPGGVAFNNDNLPGAIYTPTNADILTGSITLTITTDNPDGPCVSVADSMVLTIVGIDDPTFSYATGTYCQTAANPLPGYIALPGGTFSESTASLSFVSTATGEIDLMGSPLASYFIQYLTNGTCPDSSTVAFNITAAPDATFSYADPFCEGASDELPTFPALASAGTFSAVPAGLEFVDVNTGEIDLSASVDGVYTITNDINVVGCAPASFILPVTINPGATVSAGNDTTICEGSSVMLSATMGASAILVTWGSPSGGLFDNPNSLTPIYTPTQADISASSVRLDIITDNPGGPCNEVSDTMILTISPLPTVEAGNNDTICSGSTYTLSGSFGGGASSITWSSTTLGSFDNENRVDATYTPSAIDKAAGTVLLTITTDNPATPCGAVSDTVRIKINPKATVNAGPDDIVCDNDTVQLNGSYSGGASLITWSSASGGFFNNENLPNALYTLSPSDIAAGSVTLTITTDDPLGPCPAAFSEVDIELYDAVVADAGDNDTICKGKTATIGGSPTATGVAMPFSYLWSSGTSLNENNISNPVSSVTITTTYTVTVTDANGCKSSDNISIVVNSLPTVSAGDDLAICFGQTIQIGGSPTALGGAGGYTYSWNISSSLDDTANANPISSALLNTTYRVTVTDANACTGSDIMNLIVYTLPTAEAGSDKIICSGQSVIIGGSPTGNGGLGPYNYNWNNAISLNNSLLSNPASVALDTTKYSVTVTDNHSCTAIDSMTVYVKPSPVANAGANQTICILDSTQVGGSPTAAGGTPPYFYLWNNGSSLDDNIIANPISYPLTTTTYSITVTDDLSCTATSSTIITVNPEAVVYAGSDTSICESQSYTLSGSTNAVVSTVAWLTETGGYFDDSTSLTATYTPSPADIDAGTVTLILTSNDPAGPCTETSDSIVISILALPEAYAGADTLICANTGYEIAGASIGGGASSLEWTSSGTGTFDYSTLVDALYIPSADDITAGSVTLYITTDDPAGACVATNDSMLLSITDPVYVYAGEDQSACKNNADVTLDGDVSGETITGIWTTSGTGIFSDSTFFGAIYLASSQDTIDESVILVLSSTNSMCAVVTDTMIISYTDGPFVDAGQEDTVCANNSELVLIGTVLGNTTTGFWTTSGSGTFSPDSTYLGASYFPSISDTASGTVTLTLTSSNNGTCLAISDSVVQLITPAPVANAGLDQSVCANNATVVLDGHVFAGSSSGYWTSDGSGVFDPDSSALNATYYPSDDDTTAGNVIFVLTTTDNGDCFAHTDTMEVSIGIGISVYAGLDQVICANNNDVHISGSVTGSTISGIWTTSGSGIFDDESLLSTIYHPSPEDTLAASVTLKLKSTYFGLCIPVADSLVVTIDTGIYVSAGSDQILCANNALVDLEGSVFGNTQTGGWTTTGTGAFVPDTSSMNLQYIPSVDDTTDGSVTLYLTSTDNEFCMAVVDSSVITITDAPNVDAGGDYFACKNNPLITLDAFISAGATTGFWTTLGSGTFSDTIDLNSTYLASAADTLAGDFVTLIIESTNFGNCLPETDTALFHFTQQPIADAGLDDTVCANDVAELTGTIIGGAGTGRWTSSGTGSFDPHMDSLSVSYIFSENDTIAGFVTLILESTHTGGCLPEYDTVEIVITPAPQVEAGPDVSVCANNDTVQLFGNVWGASNTGHWTTIGTGDFIPNDSTFDAIYVPTDEDTLLGTFPIYLTASNIGNCISVTDSIMLTITTPPSVFAGEDKLICKGNSVELNGTVNGGASSGQWYYPGIGNFLPNADSLVVTFVPSEIDTLLSSLEIMLVSTNNGQCLPAYDTMTLYLETLPNVYAGINDTVCANNSDVSLNGQVSGTTTSGIWTTSGSGTFSPDGTIFDAIYLPSDSDTAFGSAILTLNAVDACPASASIEIVITPAPFVNAGGNQSVCIDQPVITLNGTVYGATSTGIWTTSGSGYFIPDSTTIDATYIRSQQDSIDGQLTLTLTATNYGDCMVVSDSALITLSTLPVVSAGNDRVYCSNNAEIWLTGSVTAGSTTGVWQSLGSGSFYPDSLNMNAIYSPSSADTAAGGVTLVLASTNACIVITDSVEFTLTDAPFVNAGSDTSSCSNNTNIDLSGYVGGATHTGRWYSSGNGQFLPSFDNLNATYAPDFADVAEGTVYLTLFSTFNGMCYPERDTVVLTIVSAPEVNAGSDQYICTYENAELGGEIFGITSTGIWQTTGTGTFVPDSLALDAEYIPSADDTLAGSVNMLLTSTNNGSCIAITSEMTINITPTPFVTAGPDVIVCSNNSDIVLNGSVSGSATTGIWLSSGTGIFSPSETIPNPTYKPSPDDLAVGSVTIVLASTYACLQTDTLNVTITPGPVVNAGADKYYCNVEPVVFLEGFVTGGSSEGAWLTNGTGYFDPSATQLQTTYYPSVEDTAIGMISFSLISTDTGDCFASEDSLFVHFIEEPTVNAGDDQTICANAFVVLLGQVSDNSIPTHWSTSGDGYFSPNIMEHNVVYHLGSEASELDSVDLTISTPIFEGCPPKSDTMTAFITTPPLVYAGEDITICANNDTVSIDGMVWGATSTGYWYTSGTGTFVYDTVELQNAYIPGDEDITAGGVELYLKTTDNDVCFPEIDTLDITILPSPVTYAGEDQFVCAGDYIDLFGDVFGATSTGNWDASGIGDFVPNDSTLYVTYSPTPEDTIEGVVVFILTSTNNGLCIAESDTMIATITSLPSVDAGFDAIVCANNAEVDLSGFVSGSSSTGVWYTSGTGYFVSDSTDIDGSYIPSIEDTANGSVTLVLASTFACLVTDTIEVTITPAPVVNAGPTAYACVDDTTVTLNSTIFGGSTTGQWFSSGGGEFTPNDSSLFVTYNITYEDSLAQGATLILTSTNNGTCIEVSDTVILSISTVPEVTAGLDQIVCANMPVELDGIVTGGAGTGVWTTSGFGVFTNSTILNPDYLFSVMDTATGTVSLILSSTFSCMVVSDTLEVQITPAPHVNAWIDDVVCVNNPVAQLSGEFSNAGGIHWSTLNDGTFDPYDSINNPIYNLGIQEIIVGSFTVVLATTENGECNAETDTLIVNLSPAPVVDAGPNQLVCFSDVGVFLHGDVSEGSSTGKWTTNGSGFFLPNDSTMEAIYMVTIDDTSNGTIMFYLTSTNSDPCFEEVDSILVIWQDIPQVNAGSDQIVCSGDSVYLDGIVSGATTTGFWTTTGSGEFVPSDTLLNATYISSVQDNNSDSIFLILTSTNSCTEIRDTIVVKTYPQAQPGFDTDFSCNSPQASFTDLSTIESGSIVSWNWNFGDNGTSTEQDPAYEYATYGNYTVSLSLVTDLGCTTSITDDISINQVVADFVYSGLCFNGGGVEFIDSSLTGNDSIISWAWKFGDGSIAIDQNPVHIYTVVDTFTVRLIINSLNNCSDTIFKEIVLSDIETMYTFTSECSSDSVGFTDGSVVINDSIVSWHWDFDDGSVDSAQNPSHAYSSSGIYSVTLTTETLLGCTDSIFGNVSIQVFTADFNFSGICISDSGVVFIDNSTANEIDEVNWSWDFGDQSTGSDMNPVHQYSTASDYMVQMIIDDGHGCIDTIVKQVQLSDVFSIFEVTGHCVGEVINFNNLSTTVNDSVVTWMWYLDEGITDTLDSTQHIYSVDNDYTVLLVGESEKGCIDTSEYVLTIDPKPEAGFIVNDESPNLSIPVEITDNSVGASWWYYDFGETGATSTDASPSYSYISADGLTTIIQIVGNEFECTDTTTLLIDIWGLSPPRVPSAFTPNNDGNNDILGVLGGPFVSMEFKIFNDWGKVIFETTDAQVGWDGTYKGKDQPVGVYVYILTAKTVDGVEYSLSGDVTILR